MGGQPDANPRPPTGPPKIGMSALPKEVLGHIFGFLGLRDLMSVRCVSGAHCAVANAVALRRGYHATHHLSDEAGLELRAWEREDWAWLTWRGKWGSWLETLLAEDKDDKDIIKALLQTQELSMWLEGEGYSACGDSSLTIFRMGSRGGDVLENSFKSLPKTAFRRVFH